MASIIEITKLTSVATTTEAGRPAIASCLLGTGVSLSLTSTLRVTGVFGAARVSGVVSERPTQAPVAEAAQAFGYASAANGAGLQNQDPGANGDTTALTQHHKMWAFRGLEPWRDPA